GEMFVFTYTITDGCDRMAECEQIFHIPPPALDIECSEDETVECLSDITPSEDDVTVINAIDDESITTTVTVGEPVLVSGEEGCDGAQYEVTYTVTDDCDQEASCTRTYTVENEGPTITAPEAVVIECAEDAAADIEGVMAMAACELDYEVTAEGPNLLEGDGFCDGSVWEFVYTVTDECGRTAEDTQMVTIENDGPTITAPEAVTIECAADAAADIEGAMAMAACNLDFEVTAEGPELLEGDGFCPGSLWQFTYTVTDECGRQAEDTQLVTISNNGPSIEAPEDITIDCSASTEAEFTGEATAFFPCGQGDVSFEDLPITGSCPQVLVRVWSATDGCSTATAEQTITLEDTTAPELFMPEVTSGDITCQQVDPVQAAAFGNGELGTADSLAFLNLVRPLFMQNGLIPTGTSDDCSDSDWDEIDVDVITEDLEDCTVRAILECIFVAVDECGNTSEPASTFLVINSVNDPEIVAPADVVIECAEDAAPDFSGVTASADCSLDFEVTASGPNLLEGDGVCDGSVWEFVYTVTDECGRTAEDTQMVTIENDGPTITAPEAVVIECAADAAADIEGAMAMAACNLDYEVTASGPNLLEGDGFC
ncbi:MAG: hypothetical protein LC650_02410, partial [Actinobacteria bacterium]|nr:hypothetical protein [Actinomycetota bacterium]